MGLRGKASGASRSVARTEPDELSVKRPDPPSDISSEEAAEWRAVVDRLPPGWFPRETHALLTQHCRQVVAARQIAEMIAEMSRRRKKASKAADALDLARALESLHRTQERIARLIVSLSSKLKISPKIPRDRGASGGKTKLVSSENLWQ